MALKSEAIRLADNRSHGSFYPIGVFDVMNIIFCTEIYSYEFVYRYVLTAARCTFGKPANTIFVVAGVKNFDAIDDDVEYHTVLEVTLRPCNLSKILCDGIYRMYQSMPCAIRGFSFLWLLLTNLATIPVHLPIRNYKKNCQKII